MDGARWINVGLGAWLFLSAWIFAVPLEQRVDQALVGMTVFMVAFVAMAYARTRWINAVLALWAIASPFVLALPAGPAGTNRLASGLVILAASLWPVHAAITQGHRATR